MAFTNDGACELMIRIRLIAFRLSGRCRSPAFNAGPAVQSKEISELLTLAQTLIVCIAAVTPDACARYSALAAVYTFGAAMSGLAR